MTQYPPPSPYPPNPYKPKKKQPKISDIFTQLDTGDIQYQSMALHAFNELKRSNIGQSDIDRMENFLEKELLNPESTIRTECFRTASKLGKMHESNIKKLFPIIMAELPKKNRFRIEIILKMFKSLVKSGGTLTEKSVEKIIENSPKWFDKPILHPYIQDFFSTVIKMDKANQYTDIIREALDAFPEEMDEFKKSVNDDIMDAEDALAELERLREEQMKREKEKARQKKKKKKTKKDLIKEEIEKAKKGKSSKKDVAFPELEEEDEDELIIDDNEGVTFESLGYDPSKKSRKGIDDDDDDDDFL